MLKAADSINALFSLTLFVVYYLADNIANPIVINATGITKLIIITHFKLNIVTLLTLVVLSRYNLMV